MNLSEYISKDGIQMLELARKAVVDTVGLGLLFSYALLVRASEFTGDHAPRLPRWLLPIAVAALAATAIGYTGVEGAQTAPVIINIPPGIRNASLGIDALVECSPDKLAAGPMGINNSGQIEVHELAEGKPVAEFAAYKGNDSDDLLVSNGKVMAGYIQTANGFVEVTSGVEPGTCRVRSVSASGVLPDIHLPGPVHEQKSEISPQAFFQQDALTDVAVFYTHELERALGNGNLARAAMLLQIADAQDVIDASGISGVTLRPVFVGPSEVSEEVPLDWYAAGAAFDNSSQTRTVVTTWSPDAKMLGVQDDANVFCGQATVRTEVAPSGPNEIGFSMVNVGNNGCLVEGRVAAEELIAHELNGVMHNSPEPGGLTTTYPWAYGYKVDTRDQVPIGMPGVMTVPSHMCQEVPCFRSETFSSPLLFDEYGRAQGDAAIGDGKRVIEELASSTANIQPSVVADSAFAVRVNTSYGGNLTPGIWVSTGVAPDVQSSQIEDTTEVAAYTWSTGEITADFLVDGKSCHVSTATSSVQQEISINIDPGTDCQEVGGGKNDHVIYLPLIALMRSANVSAFGYPPQPDIVSTKEFQLPLVPAEWYEPK